MKRTIITVILLILIIGNIGAIDTGSYLFIEHLINISGPAAPELFDDGVIFTAPPDSRRTGIAFAHEGFAKIYWFQRLLVPEDQGPPPENAKEDRPTKYRDTGLLFYVYTPPATVSELGYRLIIDGLWSADPLNPRLAETPLGLAQSVVALPPKAPALPPLADMPGILTFSYRAPAGEKITVGGTFNGWDPFMYEMKEKSPGLYSLSLPLPPGTYHYMFYHRGERIPDPANTRRVYTKEGKIASEAVVK
ncbi:hypothetical protein AGMMS49928_19160 [Spirochaetia bacterium]|nr:hypothetical protein AGMMS49928_19160 [Spirochaetia bacterium]